MSAKKQVTFIEPIKKQKTDSSEPEKQKLKVAAYARVSTEQDEQQNSFEAQVDYYTKYIASKPDWEPVEIFSDEGITGTNTKKREGFNRMIDLALAGGIDLILTKSISRFARNTVDTLQTVRNLKAVGVEVIFEKENLHTLDPKCEMLLTIMSSLAQEESRSISENVRWGKQKSMQDGNVQIAYSTFLGYKKGKNGRPEIVEEEAAVIREIYNMCLDGMSYGHIAQTLTKNGIPTPAGKPRWHIATVKSILQNEKYKGDALLQKTYTVDYLTKEVRKNNRDVPQYYVKNSHPAIIDEETFEKVQKTIKKREGNGRCVSDKRQFSSLLICGDCGQFYGHKVWHKEDVWYCNNKYHGDHRCTSPVIRETELVRIFDKFLQMVNAESKGKPVKNWRRILNYVTANPDGTLIFHLYDDTEFTLTLQD